MLQRFLQMFFQGVLQKSNPFKNSSRNVIFNDSSWILKGFLWRIVFYIYFFKRLRRLHKDSSEIFSGLLARVLPVIHPTIFSGSLFEKFRQNYFLGFISGILKKIVSMHPFQMQFRNSSKNFSILSFFSPGNSYMDFFFSKVLSKFSAELLEKF